MGQQFEASFHGSKDAELFFHYWKTENPRATVLVTHGLAEHSECYTELAERLNKANYDVLAWDLRGHGRSEGKRGYIDKFDDFEFDLFSFIKHASNQGFIADNQLILFGHSMGGLINAKTILNYDIPCVVASVFSCPGFGIAVDVPKWKQKFTGFGAKWLPKVTLWNEIMYEDLTRDEQHIIGYDKDPLRHDKISPGLFKGMLEGQKFIRQNETKFKLPFLMQVAGSDKITASSASIRFYERAESADKTLQIYEDSYHEIYNDLDKELVYKDLLKFLNHLDQKVEKEKNGKNGTKTS